MDRETTAGEQWTEEDRRVRSERLRAENAALADRVAGLAKAVPLAELDRAFAGAGTAASTLRERPSLNNIDDLMRYQPWRRDQQEAGDEIRDALTLAAKAILRRCPEGRFRDQALDAIIAARMHANAAISFSGRF